MRVTKSRPSNGSPGNRLLARLPTAEYRQFLPHLQPVTLRFKQVLYRARSAIDYAYFPVGCLLSIVVYMHNGSSIEVGAVGNDGVVGLPVFLGAVTTPHLVIVQVAGAALRIKGDRLEKEAGPAGPLRQLLLRYQDAFQSQVFQGVACNGLHNVQQRCCRWLLETQDRVQQDEFTLTHEFLAVMLGVRRATISEVLEPLQKADLIRSHRGKISILDRAGIESATCECYQAVKDDFARLLD